MASMRARINPDLLTWARSTIGLSTELAAKKIGVPVHRLEEWERGDSKPTIKQLRKCAALYKRPLAAFYLSTPPQELPALHDFRRSATREAGGDSPALLYAIRDLQERREEAYELARELDESIPEFVPEASTDEDAENVGDRIRELLGVSVREQESWRDPSMAFRRWREAIEEIGVLVFQFSNVEITEARGLSVHEQRLPAIAVNSKDYAAGKVFSIFHEFAHLLLRSKSICDFETSENAGTGDEHVEIYCNRVAAATLMPREALLNQREVASRPGRVEWPDSVLEAISRNWSVSREVVLRRLLTLNRTTSDFYNAKRAEFVQYYRHLQSRRQGGFAPIHRQIMAHNGARFIRLVLGAYYDHRITASEVSGLLRMKLNHLSNLESELSP